MLGDPSDTGFGWLSLLTADGRTVSLAAVAGVVRTAYQIADGWRVVCFTPATGNALWTVAPDGSAHRLIGSADGIALGPYGRRFAWRAGDRLYVAHLAGTTLVQDHSTPSPARSAPIAYTGTAVILGYSETGGGIDHHDVWFPALGDYSPSWDRTAQVAAVYQPAPDGSLYGQARAAAGGKAVCLAKLDPDDDLRATRTACGLAVTIDPLGLVSPDGRWMVAPAPALADDGHLHAVLLDLDRVFDNPVVTTTWAATGPEAWLDATTVVLSTDDGSPVLAHVGQGLPSLPSPEPAFPLVRMSRPYAAWADDLLHSGHLKSRPVCGR